ncbi:tail fiber protein, partial [Alistipes putredinis]
DGYALCEGQQLKQSEYPELYKAIGTTYNNAYDCNGRKLSTTSGYFRLPDLRSRFVVGYNVSDADYGSYGKVGGEKRHTLTVDEIPSHAHGQNLWTGGNGSWRSGGSNSYPEAVSWHDRTTPFGSTKSTGGGGSHENRPPYYTLAYVMRTK